MDAPNRPGADPPNQPGPHRNRLDPLGLGHQPVPAPLDPLALANELLAEMNPPAPPAPPPPPAPRPALDPLGLGRQEPGNVSATQRMPAIQAPPIPPPPPTANTTQRMPALDPATGKMQAPPVPPPPPTANTTQRMPAPDPATLKMQAPPIPPPPPTANTTQRMPAPDPAALKMQAPPIPRPDNVNTTQRMTALGPTPSKMQAEQKAAPEPRTRAMPTHQPDEKPPLETLSRADLGLDEVSAPKDPWARVMGDQPTGSDVNRTRKMKAIRPDPPVKDVGATQRMTALTPPAPEKGADTTQRMTALRPDTPTRDVNTTQKMTALGNVTRLMPAIDGSKPPLASSFPTKKIPDARTRLVSKDPLPAGRGQKARSGVAGPSFLDLQVMRIRRLVDKRERIAVDDVVVFTRQFCAMVTAGLPLHQSLYFYAESNPDGALNRVVHEVADKVGEGNSLSHAMRRYPDVFSEVYTGLIAAGESTGMLSPVLSKLADLSEKNQRIRKKIWSTLTYPLVLMAVSFCVVLAFLYFVLPMMIPLFTSLSVELPLPTRILIWISDIAKNPITVALLVLLPVVTWLLWPTLKVMLGNDPQRLRSLHRIPLGIPMLGRMMEKIITARIMFSMATLLDAGYALNATLEKCEKVAGNAEIAWRLRRAREMLVEGCSAAECLQRANVFPNSAIQMIAVGEESASLSDMIARVARVYEDEIELTLLDLAALLEPLILIGMGLVVGFLVLAAVMPTIQLLDNF